MFTTEQLLNAQKTNAATLFGLTTTVFEGIEKLAALNLQAMKASLDEATQTAHAAASAKDPQALLALQAGLLQPAAEKAAAYSRQVYEIVAATSKEVTGVLETTAAETQRALVSLVDAAMKNAPAGSENLATLMKSAVASANDAYENLQKSGRQMASAAEENAAAFTASTLKSVPAGKGRRAA